MPELENVDPETVETVVQVRISDLPIPVRDLILILDNTTIWYSFIKQRSTICGFGKLYNTDLQR